MTAGDPEQRLQKVMDKLYHAPKPRPWRSQPSGYIVESDGSLDKEMRVPAAAPAVSIGGAPTCRPWDRGDLMRRLATFKAMTWFGKPKAISSVSCARRGWINAEMDVIVCEACGAILLFSTPSSWSFQQVEKAAAVFSLKLDNGHKLLCPWIDNTCDEGLALFPPTPPNALVESYRGRSFALMKLSALPMISSSAIDYMKMKTSLVERFLSEASHYPINLSNNIKIVDSSICKDTDDGTTNAAADVFYQVLKLICLCGWEPRLLPYFVDSENKSAPSRESVPASGLTIYSTGNKSSECVDPDVAHDACDPASAVLDCKFCGACVALWGLATIQRPLEVYTLVAGSSSQNEPTNSGVIISTSEPSGTHASKVGSSHDRLALKEKSSGLNLTIAGGPPATKQNFKPRISFPIVSRHLRAELVSTRYRTSLEYSSGNQLNGGCLPVESPQPQNDMHGSLLVSHGEGSLKRKRSENASLPEGTCTSAEVHGASTSGGGRVSKDGEGIVNDDGNLGNLEVDSISKDGEGIVNDDGNLGNLEVDSVSKDGEGIVNDGNLGNLEVDAQDAAEVPPVDKETSHKTVRGSMETTSAGANVNHEEIPHVNKENAEKAEASHKTAGGSMTTASTEANVNHEDVDLSESITEQTDICSKSNNDISTLQSINNDGVSNNNSESNTSAPAIDVDIEKGEKDSNITTKIENPSSDRLEVVASSYANNEDPKDTFGKRATGMQFDPIRQHRPYCPWVVPDDGDTMPGWKLMLTALVQHRKDSDSPAAAAKTSYSFLDDMDDPLVSVRRLFASPPQKRLKGNR